VNKIVLISFLAAILCGGCESTPHTYTGKDGVTYHEDKDIQGVWLADGFDFNGYDSVVVLEPTADAESRSDEEKAVLATARKRLQIELVNSLEGIQLLTSIEIHQRSSRWR